ncbi:DUF2163 domain-containing protein [Parvibium lacunae]|uniref:DUF2163 domain-containing protein n=1 Tax=Parvibium lacunae TaxID=1888893 RepID=A0A368L7X6_9BURK|nr:DUF2163 domain-containing protein [Parvibium lacunae]RCS59714.1 DUF2163 domain-containing protein [Parvibium lacunae]
MKTASTQLRSLIESHSFVATANLYRITLASGTSYTLTDHAYDLFWSGSNYISTRIAREKVQLRVGIEVDSLQVTINTDATQAEPLAFTAGAQLGVLDGAAVSVERAYLSGAAPYQVAGTVYVFSGAVAEVECDSYKVRMTINSQLDLLNIEMPRNKFQAACGYSLYDQDCGVNRASYMFAATVQANSTRALIKTNVTQADGWFDGGSITFVTGNNAGSSVTILKQVGGDLTLARNVILLPQAGQVAQLYPGCNKTQAACAGKFNNLARFRGMPYLPQPEQAF